ncbi:MAG TPA: FAD-binding oxidoreductase [Anaerolineae bacterium]|nr:FAD-binding oxidoreductase [Anaerolineae bacterium]
MSKTRTADFIVIGGGVVGCSVACNLAQNGARNVVVLERGEICSGGTAKSCAIVRTHYSIEANLLHAVESLKVFANFDEIVGGSVGWRRTGYLILGPAEHREPMMAVFRKQKAYDIDTAIMSPAEARNVHPLIQVEDVDVIGYDSMAGYADPYLTTTAYARRAKDLGVGIETGAAVTGIDLNGATKMVHTTNVAYESPVVVLAAGPWVNQLGRMIGVSFPYEVSRHKVVTLKIDQRYQPDWPIVKDLTTPDKIYFRPETGGVVLVGTGDHGDPIEDPDTLRDRVDLEHVTRIDRLISNRMPAFKEGRYISGWTGPYDITPDWNPLVGPVPGHEGLFVATGFSGHGFKLAPTIGEGLAQTILGQAPRVPIDIYAVDRFNAGQELHGAYGIGSIS